MQPVHPDTFLNALSAFWHRYFADIGDLRAFYQGSSVLLGQAYVEFLESVLNTAVVDTPLFRKEYYKLLSLREDKAYAVDGDGSLGWTLDQPMRTAVLQNQIINPTVSLHPVIDFRLSGDALAFYGKDYCNYYSSTAEFTRRTLDVATGGRFTGPTSFVDLGARPGHTLEVCGRNIEEGTLAEIRTYRIAAVRHGYVVLDESTPLPDFPLDAYSWRLLDIFGAPYANDTELTGAFQNERVETVVEISLWAVDAEVDYKDLYNRFGYLFSDETASTEIYRAFLRGVMQLYTHGPALERVESALNVVASMPVVLGDEVLTAYDSGVAASGNAGSFDGSSHVFTDETASFSSDYRGARLLVIPSPGQTPVVYLVSEVLSATTLRLDIHTSFMPATSGLPWKLSYSGFQTVTTDKNTYRYPVGVPLREDVKLEESRGVLTFRAFEPLSTVVNIHDYVKDSSWWHYITLPSSLIPHIPASKRSISPMLYTNTIGTSSNVAVGDPGYFIGGDETGQITSNPYRHSLSFILMDRYLKANIFGVTIDRSVNLTDSGVLEKMYALVQEVRPTHTYAYIRPDTALVDALRLSDSLHTTASTSYADAVAGYESKLTIGDWVVGEGFRYTSTSGGGLAIGPAGGAYMPFCVGGVSPLAEDPTNGTYHYDRALYVTSVALDLLLTESGDTVHTELDEGILTATYLSDDFLLGEDGSYTLLEQGNWLRL